MSYPEAPAFSFAYMTSFESNVSTFTVTPNSFSNFAKTESGV